MNSKTYTIGLDLGDRRHHACVLDATGEIVAGEVIVNTREVLTAFSAPYPHATIVMETGTHSPWISRLLVAKGHPVIVANARKLRAISESQTKSDREDAQMLARLGRADPKRLSPVRHRCEATQRALVRLKVREALVRSRVKAQRPAQLGGEGWHSRRSFSMARSSGARDCEPTSRCARARSLIATKLLSRRT